MASNGITSSSVTNFLYQNIFFVASDEGMYSTFMIKFIITVYLKLFQPTAPPLHKKILSDVDFRSLISDIKSELVYPYTLNFLFSKIKNISLVLLKYLRIYFIKV